MDTEKEYEKSTSGGVAYALMKWFVEEQGGVVFGVVFDTDFNLVYQECYSVEKLEKFRGSKYVIADVGDAYKKIKNLLFIGRKVMFVGVPCHVAGLYSYLNRDYGNLFTVDLICHGTPSQQMNKEHIHYLIQKNNISISDVSYLKYRKNQSYNLRLYNDCNECNFENDEYEDEYVVAFVHGLSFRESCYQCFFAKEKRIGDITLGDFWGLGLYDEPFNHFTDRGVNMVIVSSHKGKKIWDIARDSIYCEKRNIDEAMKEQVTLSHPTQRPSERDVFLEKYKYTQNFEKSVIEAYSKFFEKSFIVHSKKNRRKNQIKNYVKRIIGFKNTQKIMNLKHKLGGQNDVSK